MGQFTIVVNPIYQGILQTQFGGYGGNYSSGTLTSPVLSDPGTTIARSATLQVGSAQYVSGANVVGFPTYLSNVNSSDISAFPTSFTPPVNNTHAVFTAIQSLNLQSDPLNGPLGSTPAPISVTAGSNLPLTGPHIPDSYGEVFSNNASPGTQPDFPASSFFDVFVNVSLPFLGSGPSFPSQNFTNATVGGSTATPLIVMNSAIHSFPPTVIYYHGNTSAVPIYFSTADTAVFGASATAGAEFGILELAGHGVDLTTSMSGDVSYFQTALNNTTPMPVLPQYASSAPGLALVSGLPTWVSTTNGTWSAGLNWSTSAAPNGVGAVGVLNKPVTAPFHLTMDSPVTVGTLLFGNSGGGGYDIGGTSVLTLDNSGTAYLTVVGGQHAIGTPIILAGNLNVSPSFGSTITLGDNISESSSGSSLILSNNGTLVLEGSNNYSGGTAVEAGRLQLVNSAALGTGGLAVDGGTVDLQNNSVTVSSLSGIPGGIIHGSGTGALDTLTVNQTSTTTFGGALQQASPGADRLGDDRLRHAGPVWHEYLCRRHDGERRHADRGELLWHCRRDGLDRWQQRRAVCSGEPKSVCQRPYALAGARAERLALLAAAVCGAAVHQYIRSRRKR